MSIVLCFTARTAEAHGGGPALTYDPCIKQTDTDSFIHFAVYQPQFNPFAEYCEALPKAGRALLVFDLMGNDLPDALLSMEVLQKGGPFHLAIPAKRYRSGIVNLQADLPRGKYIVVVGIEGPEGSRHLTFPLAVGAWWNRLATPMLIALLIILATAGFCAFEITTIRSELNGPSRTSRLNLLKRKVARNDSKRLRRSSALSRHAP